jgi:hypothetical protein
MLPDLKSTRANVKGKHLMGRVLIVKVERHQFRNVCERAV